MSKSKAFRQRKKRVREGGRDVTVSRGTWHSIVPVSRMTKTKQDTLLKMEKKYKKTASKNGNGFFIGHLSDMAIG